MSRREDGQWFFRRNGGRLGWGAWEKCPATLYQFSRYIDKRAGNARLPNE